MGLAAGVVSLYKKPRRRFPAVLCVLKVSLKHTPVTASKPTSWTIFHVICLLYTYSKTVVTMGSFRWVSLTSFLASSRDCTRDYEFLLKMKTSILNSLWRIPQFFNPLRKSSSNQEFAQHFLLVESSWCMSEKQLYEDLQESLACFGRWK